MSRSARSRVSVFLLLVIVIGGIGAPALADAGPRLVGDTQVNPDRVLMRISLEADGTATWVIEYRIDLDTDNETAAFESLQADIRANRSEFESQFARRMRRTVRAAENATGREMAIRNVTVETSRSVSGETGIIRYSFEWIGFAVVDGRRLRAGDAISGLVLDSDTELFVSWPETYGPVEITPEPDEQRPGVAIWRGRETFASDEPRIVLSTAETPIPTATTASPGTATSATETTTSPETTTAATTTSPGDGVETTTGGPGDDDGGTGGGSDATLLLVGLLALAIAGAGGWLVYQRTRGSGGRLATSGDGSDGGGAETEDATSDEAEEPPEELLSNEERVLRLLEDNGGRMKQQDVVSELDWTDAKTSQVVNELKEEGEIEVFRIGRENVLALPEESDL